MKILMLNYEFPPLGGGAGNATNYLLKEFSNFNDLEIDLVTSSIDEYKEERFANNINIYYLDIGKKNNLHYQNNKDLLRYSWQAYWFCKKLIRQQKYDLTHVFFGIPCGFIAMKLDLPYLVSLRGSDVPFYNKRFYWLDKLIFKKLSRKIWRRAKAVIANSQGLKKLAQKANPNQKIETIHNGVNIKQFKPGINKNREATIKLISTGRLIERKGYKYLIRALQNLDNIELTLVGGGNQQENLRELAERLNVNIKFYGGVDHQMIPLLLKKATIFILPSLNEGMSNSILEAMACGLPLITTDTGGSTELVRGNGFIVSKASPKALREAIVKYIENPLLIHEHGSQSRKIAEEMSWISVANAYRDIYFASLYNKYSSKL